MHDIRELVAPAKAPLQATPVGSYSCTLCNHDFRAAGLNEPLMMRAIQRWGATHKPERLTLNLRGPSCLLAAIAIHRGVPFDVAVCRGQLDRAPWDVRDHLLYLWFSAGVKRTFGTPQERDAWVASQAPVLTLADICGR